MASPSANTNNYANNVSIAAGIFAEHSDFIYSVLRYKAREQDQVEDLYQDFFLSLVSNPPLVSVRNIRSYIYKAITNDIIDAARRTQRYQNLRNKYADYLNFSINKKSLKNASIDEGQMNRIFKLIEGRLTPSEIKAITVSRYISVGLKKIRRYFNVKRGKSQ